MHGRGGGGVSPRRLGDRLRRGRLPAAKVVPGGHNRLRALAARAGDGVRLVLGADVRPMVADGVVAVVLAGVAVVRRGGAQVVAALRLWIVCFRSAGVGLLGGHGCVLRAVARAGRAS